MISGVIVKSWEKLQLESRLKNQHLYLFPFNISIDFCNREEKKRKLEEKRLEQEKKEKEKERLKEEKEKEKERLKEEKEKEKERVKEEKEKEKERLELEKVLIWA